MLSCTLSFKASEVYSTQSILNLLGLGITSNLYTIKKEIILWSLTEIILLKPFGDKEENYFYSLKVGLFL